MAHRGCTVCQAQRQLIGPKAAHPRLEEWVGSTDALGLFAPRSNISEMFEIALVTYDDAAAARVELLQDDRGRVDGQNPDIQNSAQNREGAHNQSESTGSSSRHVGSSSTNARRNQWRPGHTIRKLAEFNSVLGGSDQQL